MSLNISLNPISKAIHMYGTAHTSCSYSLSGSVHLKLSKTPTLFPSGILRPRSTNTRSGLTNIVLTSLIVTFEGKSEHHQEGGGYSAARLCTVSQQLITSPITLQLNEDQQHATHYDIIFDLLTIPGWLPSTFTGTDTTHNAVSSTSYSLFATATYHTDSPSHGASPSLTSTFCNLMSTCNPLSGWSRADKKSHADRVEIQVIRHLVSTPPAPHSHSAHSIFPPTSFGISAQAKASSPIPNDIISRLQIHASVPSFVSTTEKSIPISLKARFNARNARNADSTETETQADADMEKLAIERIEIDLDQNEMYHAQPDDGYTSRFALPSEQPPTHPLLHQSSWDHFEQLGLILNENRQKKWVNVRSVLDDKEPSSFFLDSTDGEQDEGRERAHALGTDWSVVKMKAALRDTSSPEEGGCSSSGMGKFDTVSPTYLSPFLRVTHTLNIALYVNFGGNKKDVVQFPLPINFIVLPSSTIAAQTSINSTTSRSYEPLCLPAYTQLFHEDGEARVDLSRGIPPAYHKLSSRRSSDGESEDSDEEEGEVEEYGRTVKMPELVPVGTREVDWEAVRSLLG